MVLNEIRRLIQSKCQHGGSDASRHFDSDHYVQLAERPLSDDGKKAREKLFNEITSDEQLFRALQKELRLREKEKRQLLLTNASILLAVHNQEMLNHLGRMVLKRRESINEQQAKVHTEAKECIVKEEGGIAPPESLLAESPKPRRRSIQIFGKVICSGAQKSPSMSTEDDETVKTQDEKHRDEGDDEAVKTRVAATEECFSRIEDDCVSVSSALSSMRINPFAAGFPKVQWRRRNTRKETHNPQKDVVVQSRNMDSFLSKDAEESFDSRGLDTQIDESLVTSNNDPWAREGFYF